MSKITDQLEKLADRFEKKAGTEEYDFDYPNVPDLVSKKENGPSRQQKLEQLAEGGFNDVNGLEQDFKDLIEVLRDLKSDSDINDAISRISIIVNDMNRKRLSVKQVLELLLSSAKLSVSK